MGRNDNTRVRAQARLLRLRDTAEKQVPLEVRQFVLGRLSDSTKFACLTDQDISPLAEAFVVDHYEWLQDNRRVGQDWDPPEVSKTQELDLKVISRIIRLQSANQKQWMRVRKEASFARTSPDSREREDAYNSSNGEYIAPEDRAAGKKMSQNDITQARNRSCSPERAFGGTKSTSPQDRHRDVNIQSKDGVAGRQGPNHHGGRESLGSTRLVHTSENPISHEAEQDSAANASCNTQPAVASKRRFSITHDDAAAQTSTDLYEYVEDDTAVQTETLYAHTVTQSHSPSVSSGWTQTPPITYTDATMQTATLEEASVPPADVTKSEEDYASVAINFYEAQYHLSSSLMKADAMAQQVLKATATSQQLQLRSAKAGVDFAVKILTHLAEGRAVKVRVHW